MKRSSRQRSWLHELRYPSNLLSLLRLLLLPWTLYTLAQPGKRRRAFALMGFAMLTDLLDGPIARHRHEVSQLGKILDPIADKLMIDGTAIILTRQGEFPRWVTTFLLGRDLVILLGGLALYRQSTELSVAHPSGKLATVALTIAILLYLVDGPRSGRPALYLAMLPFAYSMAVYIQRLAPLFKKS